MFCIGEKKEKLVATKSIRIYQKLELCGKGSSSFLNITFITLTKATFFQYYCNNVNDLSPQTANKMSCTLPQESLLLMILKKKPLENIVEKEENAGYQHFVLFPQYFLPVPKKVSIFQSYMYLFCCLQMLWIWTSLKNVVWSKVKLIPNDKILDHMLSLLT